MLCKRCGWVMDETRDRLSDEAVAMLRAGALRMRNPRGGDTNASPRGGSAAQDVDQGWLADHAQQLRLTVERMERELEVRARENARMSGVVASLKGTLREAVGFATAELDSAAAREAQMSATIQQLRAGRGAAQAKFTMLENEASRLASVTDTLIQQRDEARAAAASGGGGSGAAFEAAVAQRVEELVEGRLKVEIERQVRVHSSRAVKGVLAAEIMQRMPQTAAAAAAMYDDAQAGGGGQKAKEEAAAAAAAAVVAAAAAAGRGMVSACPMCERFPLPPLPSIPIPTCTFVLPLPHPRPPHALTHHTQVVNEEEEEEEEEDLAAPPAEAADEAA
jgi:hypothetical protein